MQFEHSNVQFPNNHSSNLRFVYSEIQIKSIYFVLNTQCCGIIFEQDGMNKQNRSLKTALRREYDAGSSDLPRAFAGRPVGHERLWERD